MNSQQSDCSAVAEVARRALAAGLSVVPPRQDGSKAPDADWKTFQMVAADEDQIDQWYGSHTGLGFVTGAVSGGLELLEFDDRPTFEAFVERAGLVGLGELVDRVQKGYSESTPSGGVHLLYRCCEVRANTKLAQRPNPEAGPHARKVLAETRGEGGFTIAAPSFGKVHPSGRPYVLMSGGVETIVDISDEERDALWDLAKSFDEVPKQAAPEPRQQPDSSGLRPGDDYAARVSWRETLQPAFTFVYERGEESYWRRQGKSIGISATTNVGGSGLFYCFSSSTSFQPSTSYTKFGVYTHLHHNGDFAAAAKALAEQGYGEPRQGAQATSSKTPAPDAEWPPLRLWSLPPVEEFPLEILHETLKQFVQEISSSTGCDPGIVASHMLAIAGGVIGDSASFLRDIGWHEIPTLFVAGVAMPGDAKSAGLRLLLPPVKRIEAELAKAFAHDKAAYLEESKKDKTLPQPICQRILLSDVTMEAIGRRLSENRRLLLALDELANLLLGFNQYRGGKGSDATKLMEMFSGVSITIDRVMNEFGEPIRIPFPHLCICGNLPPASLAHLVNRTGEDGLIDRFCYSFPDRRPKLKSRQRKPVSPALAETWDKVVGLLWNRQPEMKDGRLSPRTVYFSNAGRDEFDRLYDEHVDEVNHEDFRDALRGPWSKLELLSGRFCLILALLGDAAREVDNAFEDVDSLPLVTPEIVRDAWKAVGYYKSHHRRVRAFLEGRGVLGMPEGARLVLNFIRNRERTEPFTTRDLTRVYPPSRGYDRATMEDGLTWLANRSVLRSVPPKDRPEGTPGRKPSPTWEIHPDLGTSAKPALSASRLNSAIYAENADVSEEETWEG